MAGNSESNRKAEGIKQYRFPKGVSGNKNGRPKGVGLTALLAKKLNERNPKTKKLWKTEIVEALLAQASAGNNQALNMILERLEGRVPMPISGVSDAPVLVRIINE